MTDDGERGERGEHGELSLVEWLLVVLLILSVGNAILTVWGAIMGALT